MIPALMYHAVTPVDGRLRKLGLADGILRAQLTAIDEAGFALLGLTEALDAWTRGDNVVALTFDDAYADFLAVALPTLEAIGAKATVYVPTDHVGSNAGWLGSDQHRLPPVMSYGELRNCVGSGLVEIGSHGFRHVPLDTLSPSDVSEEPPALQEPPGEQSRYYSQITLLSTRLPLARGARRRASCRL